MRFDQKFYQIIDATLKVQEILKDSEKTKVWMTTDNLNLGGTSPLKLIYMGRGHKLLQFIEAAQEGNIP